MRLISSSSDMKLPVSDACSLYQTLTVLGYFTLPFHGFAREEPSCFSVSLSNKSWFIFDFLNSKDGSSSLAGRFQSARFEGALVLHSDTTQKNGFTVKQAKHRVRPSNHSHSHSPTHAHAHTYSGTLARTT
eukprot:GHVU01052147.1.p1 GENE.GHVU01052147.1~~GHVU01052147.1.p1  ORF type:complete len:131 (-),score=4.29 GHVU01052147.1:888-1280(-)